MDTKERARRYRARKRGENVPKLKPGPRKGYKQTEKHIEKRKRFGPDHHGWKGNDIVVRAGRTRALRGYPQRNCENCGNPKSERHHIDNDPRNNQPSNIRFLCRKCHMKEDGRLEKFRELGKQMWKKAQSARWP